MNALSLEDITTYIEGAPVLTRVLPVTSITRNLAARVRSNSPVAAATGSGPGPRYIKSNLHTWENYSENWTNNRSFQSNTLGYYGNNTLKRYPLFRVWASPVYLHESEHGLKTENRRTGYTANIWGALAGADVTIGPWTIGGGISFGTGKAHSTNSDMARTKDSLEYAGALLYGIWMHDDWVFSLEGVYTRTKNDIRQSTPIMTLKSRVHVDDFSAQAIIGKNFSCNGFQILPNIGLEYARMVQHETTVKGTFEGQIYNLFENGKATQNIWNLPIGLNVSRSFHYKNLEITPAIQARYIASLGDRGTDIRAWRSDAPWISTVMKGVTMDRHTGEIGTSLTIAGERALFSLGYTYQGSKQRNSHMLSGTIGCTF